MGETDAANYLIGLGCDVIAEHCNTAYPLIAAQRAHVWGVGFNSDMSLDAPEAALTSVLINWGVYYTGLLESVIDGTFSATPYFGGLAEGMVGLAPLSSRIAPPGTEETIDREQQRIVTGGFHVFEGILKTSEGGTVGSEGSVFSTKEIVGNIHWYYRNVIEH
jgi:basic membrane protein A